MCRINRWGTLLLCLCAISAGCKRHPASENNPATSSALAASSGPNSPPPAAQDASTAAKLAMVFAPDALGENVAHLETITGPDFSATPGPPGGSQTINTYKVDRCRVLVGVSNGTVDNVGIENYGGDCQFQVGQYFHQDVGKDGKTQDVVSSTPTIGELTRGLGGTFVSDCITFCGNAADPVVLLEYDGSHADNFDQLVATIVLNSDNTMKASEVWASALAKKYGNDYPAQMDNTKDNLNDVADDAFRDIRPTTIQVGQRLIANQ